MSPPVRFCRSVQCSTILPFRLGSDIHSVLAQLLYDEHTARVLREQTTFSLPHFVNALYVLLWRAVLVQPVFLFVIFLILDRKSVV